MIALFPENVSVRGPRFITVAGLLLVLAAVPIVAASTGGPFYVSLALRILIFALAASSLNLLLGYGGLVSFGHALYLGVGAYVVAIFSFHGITNGWVHFALTVLLCSVIALLTGLICLRTSGIAFIMITLAFAQMFFYLVTSLKYYGGDDGLAVARRSNFEPLFSIQNNIGLYYTTTILLVVTLYFSWRLVHSRLGRVSARRELKSAQDGGSWFSCAAVSLGRIGNRRQHLWDCRSSAGQSRPVRIPSIHGMDCIR